MDHVSRETYAVSERDESSAACAEALAKMKEVGLDDSLQVCGPRMGRIARRAVQWSSYLSDLQNRLLFQECFEA